MISPGWIARRISNLGIRLQDWGGRWVKAALDDVPTVSGIYALYHGSVLQYIGKSTNLKSRLKEWERRHYYRKDFIPFGSYAWFRLPRHQLAEIESDLISYYQPPYNDKFR